MPFSRYSRRTYNRRASARRPWTMRKRLGASFNVSQYRRIVPYSARNALLTPKQGFPERLTVNLPYQKNYRSNPGILTGTDDVFSLSNMTDLDVSGGGAVGQARGWDQWAPMYASYRVNYVRVDLKARQRASHGIQVLLVANSAAGAITSAVDTRPWELHGAVDCGVTSANQPPIEKTVYLTPAQALGMTKTTYQMDPDTSGPYGGSPSKLAYLHVMGFQIDAATVADWEYELKMTINVTLFDRNDIAAS